MTLIEFIRLIYANSKLILGVGIVMATAVFFSTRDEPQIFQSHTVLYTGIASAHTIEGTNKADFYNTSNAFDNLLTLINSRDTKEEVAVRLLAEHLVMTEPDNYHLNYNSWSYLNEIFPPEAREGLVAPGNVDVTATRLDSTMKTSDTNAVYLLVNSKKGHYSMEAMNKINAFRVNSSDLIQIEFESDDAGICKRTLELVIEVFIRNNREIKRAQSTSVVEYFEEKLAKAQGQLNDAESNFLNFNKQHNIINYYEQTKHISAEKEHLDKEITEMKMNLHGAEAAVKQVEGKLGGKVMVELYSAKVMEKRHQISDISRQITMMELNQTGTHSEIEALKLEQQGLMDDIEGSVSGLFLSTHSTEGLPLNTMLDHWIDHTMLAEEARAKLTDLEKRKEEFNQVYKTMAPIGAELKRIERAIDVFEKEYLNILHNLNQAKLRQQNIELTTKLDVIDVPFFPTKALPSKRKMLIVISFIAGMILTTALLFALEFFNPNLKTDIVASRVMGIKSLGMFPLLTKKGFEQQEKVLNTIDNQLVNSLLRFRKETGYDAQPVVIPVVSMQSGEGKTMLSQRLKAKLERMKHKVAVICPSDEDGDLQYTLDDRYFTTQDASKLHDAITDDQYDYVLLEMPNLIENQLPPFVEAFNKFSILIVRANRSWSLADKRTLENYKTMTEGEVRFILNGIRHDTMEYMIGEVPKKRSFVRRFAKRMVKMDLKSKSKF